MSTERFLINPQLLADSHALLQQNNCHIRLHKNASVPWVIIIPETTETEFCELSTAAQLTVTSMSKAISGYFKNQFGSEKINFAAIGNVVNQLHVHVIGRDRDDPLWPDVVWGRSLPAAEYSEADLKQIKKQLKPLLEEVQ